MIFMITFLMKSFFGLFFLFSRARVRFFALFGLDVYGIRFVSFIRSTDCVIRERYNKEEKKLVGVVVDIYIKYVHPSYFWFCNNKVTGGSTKNT